MMQIEFLHQYNKAGGYSTKLKCNNTNSDTKTDIFCEGNELKANQVL